MKMRGALVSLWGKHGHRVDLGVNVHLARVAAGTFAGGRYDLIGTGVNHAFLMGRGAGIRVSEPVYRQLPNDQRGPWRKRKPPAVYELRR